MPGNRRVRPKNRASRLKALQQEKMARSIHAYVRGKTRRFYELLSDSVALPEAPTVWICGDCHAGNLGPIADDAGRVSIQLRDFDEATQAHPAWDICRLALSMTVLARGSDIPGIATVHMLESLFDGYASAFADDPPEGPKKLPVLLRLEVRKAHRKSWKTLAKERTAGHTLRLPLGKAFWPLTDTEQQGLKELFARTELVDLASQLRRRDNDATVVLQDAAYWRKGCSSLGRLRFAALLDVDQQVSAGEDMCLMDVKEAHASCVPTNEGGRVPADHGLRVVTAARALSPALGERMRCAHMLGTPVFVRELMPQDMKLDVKRLNPEQAKRMALHLGCVVGRAHARQLSQGERRAWQRELLRSQKKASHAPAWLWQGTMAALSDLDASYIEHCRMFLRRR